MLKRWQYVIKCRNLPSVVGYISRAILTIYTASWCFCQLIYPSRAAKKQQFLQIIALICLWLASGFYLHIHFPLNFSRYVACNTSHNSWDQSFSSHYQYCLLVSGTVSWHKLRCCYCSNMLQHWVGGETWFICEKWIILEFQETFARID